MKAYRLASLAYAHDLSGEGAAIYGGRWNPVGVKALYTSESVSLCILEILARTQLHIYPPDYQLVTIEFPETGISIIEMADLKAGWKQHIEYTHWIGEEFLRSNKSLALQVPSAIVERENNFLLNPLYKNYSKVKIINIEPLNLDKRLMQI
ncbi:MAG: RES family NAD+ phosphorylase [Ginsengibacter sp.]